MSNTLPSNAPNLTFIFNEPITPPDSVPATPSTPITTAPVIPQLQPVATTRLPRTDVARKDAATAAQTAKKQKQMYYLSLAGIGVGVLALIIWLVVKAKKSDKEQKKQEAGKRARAAAAKAAIMNSPVIACAKQESEGPIVSTGPQGFQKQGVSLFTGGGPIKPNQYTFSTATQGAANLGTEGANLAMAHGVPILPNTYTWESAGPRFGATVGAIPEAIQAIQSPVSNWVGSFAPVRSGVSNCF